MKYWGTLTAEDISGNDYDYLYKIVVIGDSKVGKTNIITRYLSNTFASTSPTWAVEFAIKDYELDNGEIARIQLWDTSGADKYRMITFGHLRRAVGAILVYDITNNDSYFNLNFWLDSLRDHADESIVILL